MPRIILPPDAFDELPDGPDDGRDDGRDEPAFPEFEDYADRVRVEDGYDIRERFAGLLATCETEGGAG